MAQPFAGELKGDGKITYDDAYAAGSAVELFHEKDFQGALATSAASCLPAALEQRDPAHLSLLLNSSRTSSLRYETSLQRLLTPDAPAPSFPAADESSGHVPPSSPFECTRSL